MKIFPTFFELKQKKTEYLKTSNTIRFQNIGEFNRVRHEVVGHKVGKISIKTKF